MNRIKLIASMLKGANTVLDIGTDHGLVIIEALKNNYIKKAIGTDLREEPLKMALKNIERYNLVDKVQLIQTDGFKNINADYDVVVITGLGFMSIKRILSMPHKKPNYYILGAQHQLEALREFLAANNFKIIDENIIYDKKVYIFLKVVAENQQLSYEDVILGPVLKTKKAAKKYYQKKLQELKKTVDFLTGEKKEEVKKKINIYKKTIATLN
ncbi:MAG: SAM-dependent methyltransferase [Acholeplasmataceae bacterium]|jgi:tRNA (adenine22-N1)-methyltransferase|nr:SAM-dependent methyltransferase [Acholeplasmataceae bacterium]